MKKNYFDKNEKMNEVVKNAIENPKKYLNFSKRFVIYYANHPEWEEENPNEVRLIDTRDTGGIVARTKCLNPSDDARYFINTINHILKNEKEY